MTTPTTTALARGLHYERDAERFLLPALIDVRAVGAAETEESDR